MPNETDCQEMAIVATSSFLRAVLLIAVLLCIMCIPISIYSLWRIYFSVKLHFNSKIVLFTNNTFVLIHCLARIVLHGKDLLNYFDNWSSGCDILPSRARCHVRFIYRFGEYIIEISPFILLIERFIATFKADSYENRRKLYGIIFFITHISIAIMFLYFDTDFTGGAIMIFFCWTSTSANRLSVNIPTFFIFFTQLATIPGLLYLLRKNEELRASSLHKHSTLTERYQISENLRTSTMFRIMSVVTWVYVAYKAIGSYMMYFIESVLLPDLFAITEVIHCLPLYYIILAALITRVDRKPRSEFKVNNYETHHFVELHKFFDGAFERKQQVGPMGQKNKIVP
ncbi:Serpentine Receptor, class AB (class A-like) [Caenorhabditis elegans]|uniref:Serpentine Receptor, class AB (Class A-like) n=1 Tax=Caenorhabditis elegans TaxID=6239 RepID=Q9GZD2_CAEEL|nr:Serpentine Receptor, class AB (class A-like) [Caenorhabditis elegans]CCD63016.1 Serpentine Receptor, class AB (class A-like) [Caenorhabditis elegans]|eukprot:NP_504368.2 Serpentine Receptor, class AB (class A-like) [Caenorhabditis elegans]